MGQLHDERRLRGGANSVARQPVGAATWLRERTAPEVEKEEACASPNTAAVAAASALAGVGEGGGVRRPTSEMDKTEAPRQIRPPWLSPDLKKAASAGVGEDDPEQVVYYVCCSPACDLRCYICLYI